MGTVDKFQGQEADAVIVSMATSSGETLPRTTPEQMALVNTMCWFEVATTPEQRIAVRPEREVCQSRVTDPASGKLQLIRVVVDRGTAGDTVVTVYRTSKVRKYWRDE